MRGLIIVGAIALGPALVVACVDGLATGPVVEEFNAAFSVQGGKKHAHRCPPGFSEVFDDDDELWDASVDRNDTGKICSNGHALIDDNNQRRKKAKKK